MEFRAGLAFNAVAARHSAGGVAGGYRVIVMSGQPADVIPGGHVDAVQRFVEDAGSAFLTLIYAMFYYPPLFERDFIQAKEDIFMDEININNFLERLKEFDALRDSDQIEQGELDRIQPGYADEWPERLSPAIRDALVNAGIPRPYDHQAQAISKSLDGMDVVMESPTASGKTLSFTAPMLHALKENPGSHALMIYPMKALAFDQREQIRRICQPLGIESWHYDGDTDGSDLNDNSSAWRPESNGSIKAQLRQHPPHILLTNPEYLNMSFLGNRESWERHAEGAKFLRNLRYVIVDEMHEYRGFFGSNMALLLRRFFLYLNRIGAHPQVFLSTATCANPQEHARSLTGRDVEVVSARAVLRPKRNFVFCQPRNPRLPILGYSQVAHRASRANRPL